MPRPPAERAQKFVKFNADGRTAAFTPTKAKRTAKKTTTKRATR